MVAVILDEPTLLVVREQYHHSHQSNENVDPQLGANHSTSPTNTAPLVVDSTLITKLIVNHEYHQLNQHDESEEQPSCRRNSCCRPQVDKEEEEVPEQNKVQVDHQLQRQRRTWERTTTTTTITTTTKRKKKRRHVVSFVPASQNKVHELPNNIYDMSPDMKSQIYYNKEEFQYIQANVMLLIFKKRNLTPSPTLVQKASAIPPSSTSIPSTSVDNRNNDTSDDDVHFGSSFFFDLVFNNTFSTSETEDDDEDDSSGDNNGNNTTDDEIEEESSSKSQNVDKDDEEDSLRGLETFFQDVTNNQRKNRIKVAISLILQRQCLVGKKRMMMLTMNNNQDNNDQHESWLNTVYRPYSIAAAKHARHMGMLDEQQVPPMYPITQIMVR